MRERYKKVLALDFDGVLHKHVSKWTGAHEIHDGPVEGAMAFLDRALDEFEVVIFSARANDPRAQDAIFEWLLKHFDGQHRNWGKLGGIRITALKPHAFLYIDDKGWRFEGTFPTMDELRALEACDTWTKKEVHDEPLARHGRRSRA